MEILEKKNEENSISKRVYLTTGFEEEFVWLATIIKLRLNAYFDNTSGNRSEWPNPPILKSFYGEFLERNILSLEERFVLDLAIVPHLQPDFLDTVFHESIKISGDFPQLGGARGKNFRGFLPTGETALFLLTGNRLEERFDALKIFEEESFFADNQILWLADSQELEPLTCGQLIVSQEFIELVTKGKVGAPKFGVNFPAQKIVTKMDWEDLVLNDQTFKQVKELELWIKHGKTLLNDWGLGKKVKPGYRVLFHGPPGTGKTLTASLLGRHTSREVFKIDLSMVVSKFIGETEKNLSKLFTKAENKDWILFFDEADALFGKRTNVKDAHDKYANQEVSYLLQRTENYSGLVILASNFKNNIDDAFTRRFQSLIYFPMPKFEERLRLWELAFPEVVKLSDSINFKELAQKYELTGANITNVVQYACLKTISDGSNEVQLKYLVEAIKREYAKEDKLV